MEVVCEEDRRLDDPSQKDIDTERDSVRLVSSTSVGPPSRTCCAATMSATSSSNNKDRPKVILVRTSSTPKQQGWKKEEDMTQEELVADKLWCEPGPQLVRLLDVAMRPENEPKDKQTTVDIVVVSDDEVEEEPEDRNGCIQTTMTRKRSSKLRRIPTRRPTTRCCTRQRQLLLRRRRRWKRKTSTMYLLLLPRLASDSSVPTWRTTSWTGASVTSPRRWEPGTSCSTSWESCESPYATTPARSTNTFCVDFVQTAADDFVWLSKRSCNEVLDTLRHRIARCDESPEWHWLCDNAMFTRCYDDISCLLAMRIACQFIDIDWLIYCHVVVVWKEKRLGVNNDETSLVYDTSILTDVYHIGLASASRCDTYDDSIEICRGTKTKTSVHAHALPILWLIPSWVIDCNRSSTLVNLTVT